MARTRVGNITQFQAFVISKYGDARAKALAIVEREKHLKKAATLARADAKKGNDSTLPFPAFID
ncbi:hypothetical protein A8M77_28770 [Variovorax sp. JS1663]|nr:hypothetical protein A8M77_28770 [Variovorax sp. JS1663]